MTTDHLDEACSELWNIKESIKYELSKGEFNHLLEVVQKGVRDYFASRGGSEDEFYECFNTLPRQF